MSNVKWQGWGDEQLANEERQLAGALSMLKLKARPEAYTLRFLPAIEGEDSPFRIVWQHYVDKPDGDRLVLSCPYYMGRQPCPLCDYLNNMTKTGNPADEKMAKRSMPKSRIYSNVIDMEHPEAGPQIFAFGKTIYDPLKALRQNPHWGDFTDPEQGYNIQIKVTGSGMETEYTVQPIPSRTELADFSWLEMKHDLTRFGVVLGIEEMELAVRGLPSGAPPPPRNNTSRGFSGGSGTGSRAALPAARPVQAPAAPISSPRPRTIEAGPTRKPAAQAPLQPVSGPVPDDNEDIPF